MNHKLAIRIYEIASYVLILAVTLILFVPSIKTMFPGSKLLAVTMVLIVFSVAARWMMERHRFRSANDEIDQLQADLRRLTQLLAEEKKKNKNA